MAITTYPFLESHFRRCICILCTPLAAHTTNLTLNMRFDSEGLNSSAPMGHAKWMNQLRRNSFFPHLQRSRAHIRVRHCDNITLEGVCFLGLTMIGSPEVEVLWWDDIAGSSAPLATWFRFCGLQQNDDAIAKLNAMSWTDETASFNREV
jgi:hypothetical protein